MRYNTENCGITCHLEEKLKESERLNRAVLDSLLACIAVLDKEGNIMALNDKWEYFTGKFKNNVSVLPGVGENYLDWCGEVLGGGIGQRASEGVNQVLDGTKKQFIIEYPCIIENEKRWCLMRVTPLVAGGGGVVSCIDITDRKRTEEELAESVEKYRLVFENTPIGICHFDKAGIITACNNKLVKITGSSRKALTGLNLLELPNEQIVTAVRKTLAGETVFYEGEYKPVTGNKTINVKVCLAPIIIDDDAVVGGVGIVEDFTEMCHIQKVMRDREKLAIIGQMAAGMAHEIKNPLTVVRGLAQLLREKCPDDEALRKFTDIILEEIDRANGVIADFLQLARPKPPVFESHSVNDLIKELLDITGPQAFLKGINVEYRQGGNIPLCKLDKNQIKQVLLNMCKNAMESMPGGGKIMFRTGFLAEQNEIYVEIQDTGCGIARDQLDNIGMPFYTTKPDGTGLGLSICYSIINAHKGRIEIDSEVGTGTTFRIFLPALGGLVC